MTHHRLLFPVACGGMLLFGVAMVSLGTVNTFLAASQGFDEATIGSLAALLPLGILAGSLVFGPLVDRFGYRLPFAGSALIVSGGFEIIALTGALPALQISFFLIGLGGGVLNGATNALVADISEGARGSRLSLLGVFFGIGALGMPALTAVLLGVLPLSKVITAIGAVILAASFFMFSVHFPAPKHPQGFPLRQGAELLRDRTLLIFSFALFFQSGLEGMVNNWTVLYVRQELALEAGPALITLTVFAASLAAARLLLGFVLRRTAPHVAVWTCLPAALLGSVLLMRASGVAMAYAGAALLGCGLAPVFPVVFAYIGELHPRLTGTAFGIALVIALTGNTVINYGVGLAASAGGLAMIPLFLGAGVVAVAVLFGAGVRTVRPHGPSGTAT
jgi:MFS family permease